jgi:AcrR family transcriptional regulator
MGPDPRVVRSKQCVIETAHDLLREGGFAAATIEAIAARSGVAKTTIYRHWPDRNRLLLDAFAVSDDVAQIASTGDLRSDLVSCLTGLAKALATSEWAETMPALLEAAERDAEFRKLSREYIDEKRRPIRTRLRVAVERGELPAGADIELLMATLAGPLFYRRFITRQPVHDRRLIEGIVAQMLAGVQGD